MIGTNVGGIPEIIEDGKYGFIVPSGDYRELGTKIYTLLTDSELYNRFRKNVRKAFKTKFYLNTKIKHDADSWEDILSK